MSKVLYLEARYDNTEALDEILRYLEVNAFVPSTDIHTTILYSKEDNEFGLLPIPKLENRVVTLRHVELFDMPDSDLKALVVVLDADDLVSLHNTLMSRHNLNYDFPEYRPHITVAYNIDPLEIDINKLNAMVIGQTLAITGFKQEISEEYSV